MRIVRCLNQIFKPSRDPKIPGFGDCWECNPGLDNKNCRGYRPTTMRCIEFFVFEKDPISPTSTEEKGDSEI